jgi:hypothetical protein
MAQATAQQTLEFFHLPRPNPNIHRITLKEKKPDFIHTEYFLALSLDLAFDNNK